MDVDFATGLVWFGVFLFSTTVHEAMHAFVAWKGGDPTAYHGGQVSLWPLAHIRREPIGMLVVPLWTSMTQGWAMGWASAPYDPRWAKRHPRRAALMAAAGPAGNLLIAVAALAALRAGLMFGWFIAPARVSFDSLVEATNPGAGFAATLFSVLLVLNVFVGLFNLLPLPPLDGSAIFTVLLPEYYAARFRQLESNGAISIIGLLVAWKVFPLFTGPVFSILLRLVHPERSYS